MSAAPVCLTSIRPPNACSVTVVVLTEEKSDQGETDSRADSIVKRVGFPLAGLVRTRMLRKMTPNPKAGLAEPISRSRSLAAAVRIATSLARSEGKEK